MLQPTAGLSNKIDHGKKHQSATSQQRAGISPRLSDKPVMQSVLVRLHVYSVH